MSRDQFHHWLKRMPHVTRRRLEALYWENFAPRTDGGEYTLTDHLRLAYRSALGDEQLARALSVMRPTWKGHLRLSLVTIPLEAYPANSPGPAVPLNQLHEECGSRIRYKKTCPIHGEVENDEIVSGYQYARGQYVVIDPDELDQLRSERDKSINVDRFVPAGSIDPAYHSGRTYYLLPDGPIGQKPYALMRQAMAETGLNAIAKVVFSNREQLVLVRPLGEKLLGMTLLEYADQVKQSATFADEVADAEFGKDEAKLARQLLAGLTDAEPDLSRYHSRYVERLKSLIEARVECQELVAPPAEPPPPIINLMEALKASVAQVRKPETPPRREMAASTKGRKPAKRKKRTG